MTDDEFRFWSRVRVGDGCWVSRWAPSQRYGKFTFTGPGGYQDSAHRASWVLANGPIPDGLWVLHRCDNPKCVRPSHLFLGTNQDNVDDRCRKGRSPTGDRSGPRKHPERFPRGDQHYARTRPDRLARGERHGSVTQPWRLRRGEGQTLSKLTDASVRQIRARYASGEKQRALAAEFGVSQRCINMVVTRATWTHVE